LVDSTTEIFCQERKLTSLNAANRREDISFLLVLGVERTEARVFRRSDGTARYDSHQSHGRLDGGVRSTYVGEKMRV
jgi:hypothetical protein